MKRAREPDRFLRAIYWHEEGVYHQSKTWPLPTELPDKLDASLEFLRAIIPGKDGAVLDREQIPGYEKYKGGSLEDEMAEEAFWFNHEKVFCEEAETPVFLFDTLMTDLCGPPVKNAVGAVYMVMVPTYR
jgi:hypothetical protein